MEESSIKKLTPSHSSPSSVEKVFDNKIDQDIYQKLSEKDNGEQLASAFLGAIKVLQDQDNPDRFAQAANSIRGIGYLMIRHVDLPVEIEKQNDGESHRLKLKRLLIQMDPAGGSSEYLRDSVTDSWIKLHEWFTGVSHHSNPESLGVKAEEFNAKFRDLKDLLIHLLQDHFVIIDEIDVLVKVLKPTQKDFDKLNKLLSRDREAYRYFFEKAGSQWFNVLSKQEIIFKKPPAPVKDDKYIIFPLWFESQYLARIAGQKPEEVFDIIKDCPDVKNPRIYEDFVRATLEMPLDKASALVKVISRQGWLKLPHSISLPMICEKLFTQLFTGGEISAAMALVHRMFDITSTVRELGNTKFRTVDIRAYYDNWEYGIILDNILGVVMPSANLRLLEILDFKLNDAVLLEQTGRMDKESIDDLSHISRPFIHSYKEKTNDIKEILISAIITYLDNIAKIDLDKLKIAINFLGRFKFQVFRRIELHYFKEFPDLFSGNIKNVLIKKFFYSSESYGLRREFIPLLGQEYNKLSTPDKNKILRILWSGPTIRNKKLSKTDIKKLRDLWLWHYLDPLQDKIPSIWKAKYRSLARKFGGNPPEDEGIMRTWSGPTSPLTVNQLRSKTAKEILEYLKTWQPLKDEFGVPSPEGLGRLFEEVVKERINEFTELAGEFIDYKMRFVYMYHFVHGLQNAFKETKQLQQWDKVIDFMEKISTFSDDELTKFPTKSDDRFEIDWNNLMGEINYFLRDVLFTQEETIPFEYRKKVWNIIQRGLKNPSPKPEDEKREEENSRDFGTMSINTVRGKAMHAAMAYAVWCSRNLKLEKQDNRLVPEVEETLEAHLDLSKEPSLTIRSVYGWYFRNLVYLNKEWVTNNLSKIFPKEDTLFEYWKVAFESYLVNEIHPAIFKIMADESKRAIEYLSANPAKKKFGADISERLPAYIAIGYTYDMGSGDELSEFFFKTVAPKIRGRAIGFIGSNLLKKELAKLSEKDTGIKLDKLKRMWNERVDAQDSSPEELEDFGWWFVNSPFDKEWNIGQLLKTLEKSHGIIESGYKVMEELVAYTVDFPLLTVRCADLIARAKKEEWGLDYDKEKYKEIIRMAIASKDTEASRVAKGLANYLGSKGFRDFKELV